MNILLNEMTNTYVDPKDTAFLQYPSAVSFGRMQFVSKAPTVPPFSVLPAKFPVLAGKAKSTFGWRRRVEPRPDIGVCSKATCWSRCQCTCSKPQHQHNPHKQITENSHQHTKTHHTTQSKHHEQQAYHTTSKHQRHH